VTREVKRWSHQIDDDIRDAMRDVDWDMFGSNSSVVSKYTDVVTSFTATLEDTIVPIVPNRGSMDPSMPP